MTIKRKLQRSSNKMSIRQKKPENGIELTNASLGTRAVEPLTRTADALLAAEQPDTVITASVTGRARCN